MPVTSHLPVSPAPKPTCELDALRAELRCILEHPAISPARRQTAEPFISRCTDAARLRQWLALVVQECGMWEENTLALETPPPGRAAASPFL